MDQEPKLFSTVYVQQFCPRLVQPHDDVQWTSSYTAFKIPQRVGPGRFELSDVLNFLIIRLFYTIVVHNIVFQSRCNWDNDSEWCVLDDLPGTALTAEMLRDIFIS